MASSSEESCCILILIKNVGRDGLKYWVVNYESIAKKPSRPEKVTVRGDTLLMVADSFRPEGGRFSG